MEKTIPVLLAKLRHLSTPSFCPLIKHLQEISVATSDECKENPGYIDQVFGDLTDPGSNLERLVNKNDAAKSILNQYFLTSSQGMNFYAIIAPFSNKIIFSSNDSFPDDKALLVTGSSEGLLFRAHLEVMYQLILKKFYAITLTHSNSFVDVSVEEDSRLQKFTELQLVADFIEIKTDKTLPKIAPQELVEFFLQMKTNKSLQEMLPLHLFTFEGIMVVKARDVTMRESICKIKNVLLSMPHFIDEASFHNLQHHVRTLLQMPGCEVFFTSSTKNCNCEESIEGSNEMLVQPINCIGDDSNLWQRLKTFFEGHDSLVIPQLSDSSIRQFNFLQSYAEALVTSLVIFPLKTGDKLIGTFSIVTTGDDRIDQKHFHNLEALIPLLVLALGKHTEKMDDEIDKVIREQFTAVQSSVNWKFTEAARNYINQKNKGQESKIENIVFENVFPLYGSVDVRNSSIERSSAIQTDLLEQLELANGIIRKCKNNVFLFSLQETGYRIEKYISTASLVLFPGDELAIQNFLDEEITTLFNHLKNVVPSVSDEIDNYFFLLNTNTNKLSKQCAAFEESILMINDELVKFINQEQKKIQEIYAHYFEYFVTDGVDFNIYMGQSITPDKPFDNFYLKNLKLWQLTTLVKAAQKVRNLQDQIPVALDTTQLILAHSKPISISFRVAERKFDVDGAYNIHYEIIKKRIDKIKIMGSNERLTQPGKIAIVFAHDKEAAEYSSYIEYLQNEGLLEMNIEYFDLEELPGVRGLKALRIGIRMDKTEEINNSLVENFQLKAVS